MVGSHPSRLSRRTHHLSVSSCEVPSEIAGLSVWFLLVDLSLRRGAWIGREYGPRCGQQGPGNISPGQLAADCHERSLAPGTPASQQSFGASDPSEVRRGTHRSSHTLPPRALRCSHWSTTSGDCTRGLAICGRPTSIAGISPPAGATERRSWPAHAPSGDASTTHGSPPSRNRRRNATRHKDSEVR